MILADILFTLLVIGLGAFGIGTFVVKYKKAKTANQEMFEDVRAALFSNDKNAIENVLILYGKRLNKTMREELKHKAIMLDFEKDFEATTKPDSKTGYANMLKGRNIAIK